MILHFCLQIDTSIFLYILSNIISENNNLKIKHLFQLIKTSRKYFFIIL